jgi:succinyl-CoA synthetase beta subunit
MRLYEFETKALMLIEGIRVPVGIFTNNPMKVAEFVEKNGDSVVKAQILAGKRMEAGGIRFVKYPVQGELASEMLLDSTIYNEEVIGVRVEQNISLLEENYVSFHYNASQKSLQLTFSTKGGKQIEKLNNKLENEIFHLLLPINQDIEWRLRNFVLSVFGENKPALVSILNQIYHFFLQFEFSLLEINPLGLTTDNEYIVLDVVGLLDSAALGRHPEIIIAPRVSRRGFSSEEDFRNSIVNIEDARGVKSDFVHLGGDIATLSVGGFLSLAVVDYILELGGKPFNYAEIKGNASSSRIVHLLKTFLNNNQIKGLLIVGSTLGNIGLDSVANGIRNALKEINPSYPIVLRVTGLGRELAQEISKGLQKLNLTILRDETTIKQSVELIIEKAYGNSNQ